MQCPPEDGDWHARREAARAILEKENFPFDQTFTFTVESNEQVQARATSFRNSCQEQLRLLGVQTDFDLVETVAYWSRPLMAPGETFCRATIPSRQTTPPSVLVSTTVADETGGSQLVMRCSGIAGPWLGAAVSTKTRTG